MTSTITIKNTKIEVLSSNSMLSVTLERTGDTTSDCSVNLFLNGSTIYYPSAEEYNGLKILAAWAIGEKGLKQVTTPIIPTQNKLSYLDVELTDFVRCQPGSNTEGNIAIYDSSVTPSWIPSIAGDYYQQIIVGIDNNIKVLTVPVIDFNVIPGQTGGDNGKVVRLTTEENTWQNATSGDDIDDLFGLAFKQNNKYYKHGTWITGLSNLISGKPHYLSTEGNITTIPPIPSPNNRRVCIGKSYSKTNLLFIPSIVITG